MRVKILLLFFVFSFLFRTDASFDQDLGRHIKLGEIITQTWQVPKTNLFSFTNPDFPFINTHWLFEVFVYVWRQTLGLQSLLILKIIIFLFSIWLVFKIIPKEKMVLFLPVGFIFLHVLRERLEFRPEIFSFLFTALTYYILEKRNKLIYFLPLIQLIWVNTHIYFFVGLILQAIFLISGRLRLAVIILILSVLASLINPNGLAGLLYPLNVKANYGYNIVENQTMFFLENINFKDPNFLFVKLSIGILMISLLILALKRKFDLKNILLCLFGVGLAFFNVRSFPYLVFLSLPAVLQNYGEIKKNKFFSLLLPITCALLLVESYFYLNGSYYKYTESQHQLGLSFVQSSQKAMDFVLSNNLPQPIFNNFDIGSYIIYKGFPKYKVFVDGRPEAYPAEFFTNTYVPSQYDYNKFKELDKLTGFKTIIFSHTDQTPWGKAFLQNVVKDENWKLVYIDDFMLVLVKTEDPEDLKPINLADLKAGDYNFSNHVSYLRLGIFLQNSGNQASANKFFEKAYQLFPQSPILLGKKSIFFW